MNTKSTNIPGNYMFPGMSVLFKMVVATHAILKATHDISQSNTSSVNENIQPIKYGVCYFEIQREIEKLFWK